MRYDQGGSVGKGAKTPILRGRSRPRFRAWQCASRHGVREGKGFPQLFSNPKQPSIFPKLFLCHAHTPNASKMSITSEEDVEEDAAPLSSGDDRLSPPSRNDSSDSNGHLDSTSNNDENNHIPSIEQDDDDDDDGEQDQEENNSSMSDSDYDSGDDDDDDDDDDEGNHFPPNPQPFSQHTFAPPFYGRPPTPLPPSPSLTSLLRPSRPTTPDASDDEHPGEPLPRARPKVPTYEYYGFALYLFSSLSFLIYLLWSYLPSPFLHALGIDYYPNRWWSLAVPSFIVMLLVYIYVALAAYNVEILTLSMSSIETVVDEAAQVAVVDSRGRIKAGKKRERERAKRSSWKGDRERERDRERDVMLPGGAGLNWREVWNEGTDAVMDVPLAGVCEVLYGEGREVEDGWEEEDGDITRI